jgi:hypothetical protein
MSASVQLACNQPFQFGTCARTVLVKASTVEDARAIAHQHGWRTLTGEDRDICPGCSGSGDPEARPSNVRELRPR